MPQCPNRSEVPRVLFVAEDVTLAHVGRMLRLARGLDARKYDVRLACGDRYGSFIRRSGIAHVPLHSMDPGTFAQRLARCQPVHSTDYLRASVQDDLRVIGENSPHLVVGDFRVSLGISTEVAAVPYINVVNGRWSPRSSLRFPVPEHPIANAIGPERLMGIFPTLLPLIMHAHIRPFNRLRKSVGLAPVSSLSEMYTLGSRTLYADLPDLAPVSSLPTNHSYLGPILWEPPVPLPEWWSDLPTDQPIVYASIGSSGTQGLLETTLQALDGLPVTGIVAAADRTADRDVPDNVFVSNYLPGSQVCSVASLLVGHGGSPYQSLEHGVPVLGIPYNVDQQLSMAGVSRAGVGDLIRTGQLTAAGLREKLLSMLDDGHLYECAGRLAQRMRRTDVVSAFEEVVDEMLEAGNARRKPGHYRRVPRRCARRITSGTLLSGDTPNKHEVQR